MTIMDKVNIKTRAVMSLVFDKEPLNYIEAAGLFGIIAQGRLNGIILEVLFNHATDPELKSLIREVIEQHNASIVDKGEQLLSDSHGTLPDLSFDHRELHDDLVAIPTDARFNDREISFILGSMAKASQVGLLLGIHQSYQTNLAVTYREHLDLALDWNYRLIQLILHRGWLPHLDKIDH